MLDSFLLSSDVFMCTDWRPISGALLCIVVWSSTVFTRVLIAYSNCRILYEPLRIEPLAGSH